MRSLLTVVSVSTLVAIGCTSSNPEVASSSENFTETSRALEGQVACSMHNVPVGSTGNQVCGQQKGVCYVGGLKDGSAIRGCDFRATSAGGGQFVSCCRSLVEPEITCEQHPVPRGRTADEVCRAQNRFCTTGGLTDGSAIRGCFFEAEANPDEPKGQYASCCTMNVEQVALKCEQVHVPFQSTGRAACNAVGKECAVAGLHNGFGVRTCDFPAEGQPTETDPFSQYAACCAVATR